MLAGYYKSKTNNNRLIFDPTKYYQLSAVYEQILEVHTNKLEMYKRVRANTDSSDRSSSRSTIKLESIPNKPSNHLNFYTNKSSIVTSNSTYTKASKPKEPKKSKSLTLTMNIKKAPRKLGSYRLQHVIGKGSFGTVYLCTDQRLKVYAMKLFNKLFITEHEKESILSEIKILSQLPTHPNTIKLIEVVEDDQFIGIVLPYFESGSLRTFVRDFGLDNEQMNEELVISLTTQILKGLQSLHNIGIIHRDIKAVKFKFKLSSSN